MLPGGTKEVPAVMGMFDDIAVDPAVDLPGPQPAKRWFQSKDLECELSKYRISGDGRLLKATEEGDLNVGYHGMLNFYTYDGDINGEEPVVWHEYNAKFTDGKLVSIEEYRERLLGEARVAMLSAMQRQYLAASLTAPSIGDLVEAAIEGLENSGLRIARKVI